MSYKLIVRREKRTDKSAVYKLNLASFTTADEATVVDILRNEDKSYCAWLAEIEGVVVAYILYTKLKIVNFENLDDVYGLAPMAVLPAYQGKGIGSKLVLESLKELKKIAAKAVFVLGHRDYYPRFGFTKAIEQGFYYKSTRFSESFFVLELKPNYLREARGEVIYNSVFDNL